MFIYNTGATLPKLRLPWLRCSQEVFTYVLEHFATKSFSTPFFPPSTGLPADLAFSLCSWTAAQTLPLQKGPISAWMVRLLCSLLSPVKATLPGEGDQGASICSLVLIMHYGLLALLFILSESAREVHNLFRLSYWALKEPPMEMEKGLLGSDLVTPLLHELQWILIGFQMQFRMLVILIKALHNTRTSACPTRSHREEMLQAPSLKSCYLMGSRKCAFCMVTSALWNILHSTHPHPLI